MGMGLGRRRLYPPIPYPLPSLVQTQPLHRRRPARPPLPGGMTDIVSAPPPAAAPARPVRHDLLNSKPPANYVADLGRGATGFTTRSDIGPARYTAAAPSLGRGRGNTPARTKAA